MAGVTKPSNPIASSGMPEVPKKEGKEVKEVVTPASAYTDKLAAMEAELDTLTKEYSAAGLQVSDFPASYHALSNDYRIMKSKVSGYTAAAPVEPPVEPPAETAPTVVAAEK